MGWRFYTPADKCSVEALHVQMEARLGRKMCLPPLDRRPILIAEVYEQDGVITHAAFLEAEAEVCALGEGPLPRQEWDAVAHDIEEVCKVYDLRLVRASVPAEALAPRLWPISKSGRVRLSPVERILRYFGFARENPEEMTQFVRWIG